MPNDREPVFVGQFPVRTELTVLPRTGPTPAASEFAEHGSIALRVFASIHSTHDNTLREGELIEGLQVLIRSKAGGFHITDVDRDGQGWFAPLGDGTKVRVDFCPTRERYVVRALV